MLLDNKPYTLFQLGEGLYAPRVTPLCVTPFNVDAITLSTFAINNEKFLRQLSKVKVTVNSNLNSISLTKLEGHL